MSGIRVLCLLPFGPTCDLQGAVLIGLVSAAALLLAAAGLAKLRQPAPIRSALAAAGIPGAHRLGAKAANRLSGAVELAVALLALLVGGRVAAALIALAYLRPGRALGAHDEHRVRTGLRLLRQAGGRSATGTPRST